jgi:uncharacterized membrane protein YphA (DoxX/SURF4 family)
MKKYLTLKNLGWVLVILTAFMLLMSGTQKIIGTEEMVKNFTFFNMMPQMVFVGLVELAAVILLMIPRTSMLGALGVSLTMAGAVSVHFALLGGAGIFVPILLGALAWSGHCLRTYQLKSII